MRRRMGSLPRMAPGQRSPPTSACGGGPRCHAAPRCGSPHLCLLVDRLLEPLGKGLAGAHVVLPVKSQQRCLSVNRRLVGLDRRRGGAAGARLGRPRKVPIQDMLPPRRLSPLRRGGPRFA